MNETLPRGIRNCNPSNIRHSAIAWDGQATNQPDKDFVTFNSMAMGVRAAAKVILTYYNRYGLHTVRQFITRWAPDTENNTPAYVRAVSQTMGVKPDAVLDLMRPDIMFSLLKSIFRHENGGDYVSDVDIKAGVALALNLH